MPFKRVKVVKPVSQYAYDLTSDATTARWLCPACHTAHPIGSCPLKIAGVERCNLCGIAHYGQARACPHLNSEEKVRAMIEALKHSSESRYLVDYALKYLKGVKGHLVAKNKKDVEKAPVTTTPGLGSGNGPRTGTGTLVNGYTTLPQAQPPLPSTQPRGGNHVNGIRGMEGVVQRPVTTNSQFLHNAQPANLSPNHVMVQPNVSVSKAGAAADAAITRMTVPSNAPIAGGDGGGGNGNTGTQIYAATHNPTPLYQQ